VTYQCQARVQRTETEVLAIHCSDYRFQAGIREFLDEGLGLRANYDTLVVPGGPQCLVDLAALPKFAWTGRKWSRILVRLHALKRLVLIAHQDCGWYKWLAQWEPTRVPVRHQQEEDLRAAKRTACEFASGLAVDLFYAGWDGDDAVVVETVCK
jgi:hypothetical protein